MTALRLQSPSPAHSMDQQAMPIRPPSKPRAIATVGPSASAERRERLLAANLAYLGALEANGLDELTEALVEKIAAGLARPALTTVPNCASELPTQERGRAGYELSQLDRINARLTRNAYRAKGDKTAAEMREADLKARETLERAPEARSDQKWRREAMEETMALADARGAEIETARSGITRIIDADVLFNLANDGRLTPEQLDVGREVRDLYDSRAQDAGAMEYTGMPGKAHDNDQFVKSRLTRAKASEFIGRIERAVAVHCSAEPVCLVALRAVCERGWPMASLGKGRAFERNCAAFARALDVADAVLRRRL